MPGAATASWLTERMRFPAHRSGSPAFVAVTVVGTAIASLFVASCGGAPTRSSERFCGELIAHQTGIYTLPESPNAIPPIIALFSKMGEVAPLDIEQDWEAIYTILKTANTVDPTDPASVQSVTDAAIASQHSYEAVAAWALKTCDLVLEPIGVVSGGADVATTTTTAPGSETTISGG